MFSGNGFCRSGRGNTGLFQVWKEAFFVRIAPYDMHIDALSRPPRTRSLCLALAGLAALWLCSLPLACLPGPFPLGVNEVFRALAASLGLAAAPVDALNSW